MTTDLERLEGLFQIGRVIDIDVGHATLQKGFQRLLLFLPKPEETLSLRIN